MYIKKNEVHNHNFLTLIIDPKIEEIREHSVSIDFKYERFHYFIQLITEDNDYYSFIYYENDKKCYTFFEYENPQHMSYNKENNEHSIDDFLIKCAELDSNFELDITPNIKYFLLKNNLNENLENKKVKNKIKL